MAWGGERGVVVVDISRRAVVAAVAPGALYHAPDALRLRTSERQRSPSLDQVPLIYPHLLFSTPLAFNKLPKNTI